MYFTFSVCFRALRTLKSLKSFLPDSLSRAVLVGARRPTFRDFRRWYSTTLEPVVLDFPRVLRAFALLQFGPLAETSWVGLPLRRA